jgi:MYXO-CTERM domain-containing protein
MHAVRFAALVAVAAPLVAAAPRLAHAAECTPPRAMIILDKSSSMTGTIGAQTKWSIAKTALDHVATTFQSQIDLGLMVFPNPDACAPGEVDVDCAPNMRDAIVGTLGAAPPPSGNYTPMSQTLDAAGAVPSLNDASRARYVVLITDGWQWCYPYDASTRFDPVDSVAALQARGITTFVVGFGDSVDALTLNQMAVAAGTALPGCDPAGNTPGAPNPCYYQADNPSELDAALMQIGVQVTAEVCDGQDNDCDGQVDEGLTQACSSACGSGTETCENGAWVGCDAPAPSAEICDGMDNDCDGTVDPGCSCVAGQTRSCGEAQGGCVAGTQTCGTDGTWGDCAGAVGPSSEMCNGVDDDCDGQVDEVDGDTGMLCPAGQTCQGGQCVSTGDPGTPPANEDGGGDASGCGCRAGVETRSPSIGLIGLAIVGLVIIRRRGK